MRISVQVAACTTMSLHTQMALLAKFAVGNQLSWCIEVMIWNVASPWLAEHITALAKTLASVFDGPGTSGTTLPAHLHPFPLLPPRSGDCFPMNYLHKFSAAAGDKSSGTEQQRAPDLSHRRTNGASSTRRAHKGAAPAGALTPLCHSYLLLCHNGPAAPAGLPGR